MSRLFVVLVLFFMSHLRIVAQTVSEGIYVIRLASNPSFVVGINGKVQSGANIVLQSYTGADSQKWRVSNNNGAMILTSMANSNCAIDIYGGKPKAGSNIVGFSKHGGDNQKWYAEMNGKDYILRSVLNRNYVLDLDHANARNGQNILLWTENKGKGQIWRLERTGKDTNNETRAKSYNFYGASNNKSITPIKQSPPQRTIVKSWSENHGNFITNFIRYSDGWVDEDEFIQCPTRCNNCKGTGMVSFSLVGGMTSFHQCPMCNKGICNTCGGTGWRKYGSYRYLNSDFYYSHGNAALYFSYKDNKWGNGNNYLYQGTKLIIPSARMIDMGNYYQYGQAQFSKDLMSITINGITYHRCSQDVYTKLYGESIRKANSVPVAPIIVNGSSNFQSSSNVGNNNSTNNNKQVCWNCLGRRVVPNGASSIGGKYGNTDCYEKLYGPSGHICEIKMCDLCGKSHCITMGNHTTCEVCNGTGYTR